MANIKEMATKDYSSLNDFVRKHSKEVSLNPLLQTTYWTEILMESGIRRSVRPIPLMAKGEASLVAYASNYFRIPYTHTTLSILEAHGGPVFADSEFDKDIFEDFLEIIDIYAEKFGCLVCKIRPNEFSNNLEAHRLLTKHRFHPIRWYNQFQTQTYLIDLSNSVEDLWRSMEKRTRWSVRKAEKNKVYIEQANDRLAFERFYRLYRESFPEGSSKGDLKLIWQFLNQVGLAKIFFAKYGNIDIASAFIITFGGKAFYAFGGMLSGYGRYCPGQLLQWRIIQWAKANEYQTYDLGGAAMYDKAYRRHDKLWNITLFKRGFGGRLVRYLGYYEKVYHPISFFIAKNILNTYIFLIRMSKR